MALISLSGLIGSGKDTVSDYLVTECGYTRESFAGPLKDAVSVIFNWDREMLEGKTAEARARREVVDRWWAKRLDIPHLTPRWVLQHFGTEVCRNNFHDAIWIASLENKLHGLEGKDIVVSDVRFINELEMLEKIGAKTVRVFRGDNPEWWETALAVPKYDEALVKMQTVYGSIHQSEWDWAPHKFDVLLSNNGTLEDLYVGIRNQVLSD